MAVVTVARVLVLAAGVSPAVANLRAWCGLCHDDDDDDGEGKRRQNILLALLSVLFRISGSIWLLNLSKMEVVANLIDIVLVAPNTTLAGYCNALDLDVIAEVVIAIIVWKTDELRRILATIIFSGRRENGRTRIPGIVLTE